MSNLFFVIDVKQSNDCQVVNKENNKNNNNSNTVGSTNGGNYVPDGQHLSASVVTCPTIPDALDDSFRLNIIRIFFLVFIK